ncbi:MAG: hypothetical protein AAFR28_05725 [Pseudomonadota bacterium]
MLQLPLGQTKLKLFDAAGHRPQLIFNLAEAKIHVAADRRAASVSQGAAAQSAAASKRRNLCLQPRHLIPQGDHIGVQPFALLRDSDLRRSHQRRGDDHAKRDPMDCAENID